MYSNLCEMSLYNCFFMYYTSQKKFIYKELLLFLNNYLKLHLKQNISNLDDIKTHFC